MNRRKSYLRKDQKYITKLFEKVNKAGKIHDYIRNKLSNIKYLT